MKWLEVILLPPGWDASPSQGYPPALSSPVPIYTPGWREALWEYSVLPKNTTQCPRPGLEPGPLAPESSALTMRPPRVGGAHKNKATNLIQLISVAVIDYWVLKHEFWTLIAKLPHLQSTWTIFIQIIGTMEPQFYKPLFNEVLDVANNILCASQSYSKMYSVWNRTLK